MKEQLFKLFTELGRPLTQEDIDACPWLPSYRTFSRRGFKLLELNEEFYYKIPNLCKECHGPIPYDKRNTNVFCSSSCSATHNNKLRGSTKECLYCKVEFKPKSQDSQYCSKECHREKAKDDRLQLWLEGKHPGYRSKAKHLCIFVRRYLHETRGTACEICGWDEKHPVDGKTLTQIDHIDGNAANNDPSNLRILCPNHHVMTPTYGARNTNSARIRN